MRPLTTSGDPLPSLNSPPGLAVTRFDRMTEPPESGVLKVMDACALPPVAATPVGAAGGVGEPPPPPPVPVRRDAMIACRISSWIRLMVTYAVMMAAREVGLAVSSFVKP